MTSPTPPAAPSAASHVDAPDTLAGMPVARTVADVRAHIAAWRATGARIGFVPTMGALHEGHLSLLDIARAEADKVLASIFVNPTQFAPHEDFDAYPRDLSADAQLLAGRGCDLLYAPARATIYPPDFATTISLTGPAEGLEATARPHFFNGVATVVAKLLNQTTPDLAVFGEKDYQQLLVIRRMAADLDVPTRILAGPTKRDADGLALSSRNAYLPAAARPIATRLSQLLLDAASAITGGADPATMMQDTKEALLQAGFEAVDYVTVRDAQTLAPLPAGPLMQDARILAVARLAGVRLLDNVAVAPQR